MITKGKLNNKKRKIMVHMKWECSGSEKEIDRKTDF